jgi:hypothetical protein
MPYDVTVPIVYSIRTRGNSSSRIGREFRRDNRKARTARDDDDDWAKHKGRGPNTVAWSRNYDDCVQFQQAPSLIKRIEAQE